MAAIDLCDQTRNGVTQVVKCSVVIDVMVGQNIIQSCFRRMFLLFRRKRTDEVLTDNTHMNNIKSMFLQIVDLVGKPAVGDQHIIPFAIKELKDIGNK